MSSIKKKKYKIVLYQAGLGSSHTHFNGTFKKLYKINKNDVYVENGKSFYDSYIDMSKFDTEKGQFYGLNSNGYYGKNVVETNEFNKKIITIIDRVKSNSNHILHVKTQLTNGIDFDDGFDSIKNQTIKLLFIIENLCSFDIPVEIFLVGHSQGGLVNLEASIKSPKMINGMIAVSTPFSPVLIAKDLLYIDRFLRAINQDGIIKGTDSKSTERYQNCVDVLTSKKYFDDLKKKWESLDTRPKLLIITGTSGLICKETTKYVRINTDSNNTILWRYYERFPFDGLVLTSEQRMILHDYEVNFADENLPCYNERRFLNYCCGTSLIDKCKNCVCPQIIFSSTAFSIAMDALKGNDPMRNQIIKSIYQGLNRSSIINENYKNYYDVYASDYSHMYLIQCDNVIATILGFIK